MKQTELGENLFRQRRAMKPMTLHFKEKKKEEEKGSSSESGIIQKEQVKNEQDLDEDDIPDERAGVVVNSRLFKVMKPHSKGIYIFDKKRHNSMNIIKPKVGLELANEKPRRSQSY